MELSNIKIVLSLGTKMKKIVLVILMMSSSLLCAEEIKLSCSINMVTEFSSGEKETNLINEILNISDKNGLISISPSSDLNLMYPVSSLKLSSNIFLENKSDSSKWEIRQTSKGASGAEVSVFYLIDRNIGKIWYSSSWSKNSRTVNLSGTGECNKIDVKKRKF